LVSRNSGNTYFVSAIEINESGHGEAKISEDLCAMPKEQHACNPAHLWLASFSETGLQSRCGS
jgi:hypothetical protein